MSEEQPKKRGRPKGSKDKSPRPPRSEKIVVEGGLPGQLVPTAEKPRRTNYNNLQGSRAGMIVGPEDRAFVSDLLREVLVEFKKPRVTSDTELAMRIDDYFLRCSENGQVPTIEELAMSVGYTPNWMREVESGAVKGFSDKTKVIIKKSKLFLQSFDSKLVISGKMNFLTYCFRAKNYYGMTDKAEYTITPGGMEERLSVEEIAKRYELPDPNETDY